VEWIRLLRRRSAARIGELTGRRNLARLLLWVGFGHVERPDVNEPTVCLDSGVVSGSRWLILLISRLSCYCKNMIIFPRKNTCITPRKVVIHNPGGCGCGYVAMAPFFMWLLLV
jgi:hypothetical protein